MVAILSGTYIQLNIRSFHFSGCLRLFDHMNYSLFVCFVISMCIERFDLILKSTESQLTGISKGIKSYTWVNVVSNIYFYMRNFRFCNLIGLEQWYFILF